MKMTIEEAKKWALEFAAQLRSAAQSNLDNVNAAASMIESLMAETNEITKRVEALEEREEAPASEKPSFTTDELNIIRQWFDGVADATPSYMIPSDYSLAVKIYDHLGIKPPRSVLNGAGLEARNP